MALLTGQEISGDVTRSYAIHVPDDPVRATVPAIVVFHGGGQDVTTIAARWGVDPPDAVPAYLPTTCWCFRNPTPAWARNGSTFSPATAAFPRSTSTSCSSS